MLLYTSLYLLSTTTTTVVFILIMVWYDYRRSRYYHPEQEALAPVRPSSTVVDVVVVSHIQRIGCQPEKTTLHGGQSRSWSAEQGKENKRKSLAAHPPPTPHTARSEKINKITRRIYRRYAGGRSRVRTRIPSARRLGLWVWLRKILHSRLR